MSTDFGRHKPDGARAGGERYGTAMEASPHKRSDADRRREHAGRMDEQGGRPIDSVAGIAIAVLAVVVLLVLYALAASPGM